MKKLLSLLLMLSIAVALWPGTGQAAVVPKLYLDGKQLESDVEPMLINNYTMVPVSTIAKGLGRRATWHPETRSVEIHNEGTKITLYINDKKSIVNGEEVEMAATAIIVSGRTMVPLGFVGAQLGLDTYWDNTTKSAHMYQKIPPKNQEDVSTDTDKEPETESPESPAEPTEPQPDPMATLDARPVPQDVTAILKMIQYEGKGSITIDYEGFVEPKAFKLTGPDRIVIDLPLMGFAPEFVAGFELLPTGVRKGEGKQTIVDHQSFKQLRYSYFTDKPATVRLVMDLTADSEFTVTQADNQIYIDIAEPPEPVVTTPDGNKIYKIVVDAGHGGKDPGAASVTKRTEKEFNLIIALKVNALLEKEPRLQPYLTRSNDTFIELADRAKFANDLKADLFVSIHANSFTPATRGTETYYSRQDSKAFADLMHKHMLQATGLPDRKLKQANFVVIKETTMPAVLIEAGFLSNVEDEKALFTESVQDRIAAEIVAGIKSYLKL